MRQSERKHQELLLQKKVTSALRFLEGSLNREESNEELKITEGLQSRNFGT
jgi:hypothetical protein